MSASDLRKRTALVNENGTDERRRCMDYPRRCGTPSRMIYWNVDLWNAREKPQAPSNEIEKRTNFVRLQLRLHTPVGQSATGLSSVMFDR
jgi:hypothetical protein